MTPPLCRFTGDFYRLNKSTRIPLSARIVAVVDVFDALLSKRPCKEPWTLAKTMEYINARAGSQFDPLVVAALSRLVNDARLPYSL